MDDELVLSGQFGRATVMAAADDAWYHAETKRVLAKGLGMNTLLRWTVYILLVVIPVCMFAASATAQTEDRRHRELLRGGCELSATDVATLETQVQANPEDVDSRLQLLGYYFCSSYCSPTSRAAHVTTVLWFIEKHPDLAICSSPEFWLRDWIDPEGYSKAKKL